MSTSAVAEMTDAETTPGVCVSADSTWVTQDAQRMPLTAIRVRVAPTANPSSRTAFANARTLTTSGSKSTLAILSANFTCALETPGNRRKAISTRFAHCMQVMFSMVKLSCCMVVVSVG